MGNLSGEKRTITIQLIILTFITMITLIVLSFMLLVAPNIVQASASQAPNNLPSTDLASYFSPISNTIKLTLLPKNPTINKLKAKMIIIAPPTHITLKPSTTLPTPLQPNTLRSRPSLPPISPNNLTNQKTK